MAAKYLLALAILTSAALGCCASDFNITNLTSFAANSTDSTNATLLGALLGAMTPGNNSITFTVHDPDPVTNSSTTCSTSWPSDSTAPSTLILCKDPAFQWRIGDDQGKVQQWQSAALFGFSVVHKYQDDSLGPPPYNTRQTFARMDINATNIECTSGVKGKACSLKGGKAVEMPIWGES